MWRAVDDYVHLSQQYGIRVLADLSASNDPRLETCQPGADPRTGLCGVYAADGQVIGLGRADGAGQLRPVRLIAPRGVARR